MNKLSEEEVCGFMKEMFSVTISREQLMNPNKEFVVSIYARFLAEFGIENVAQPDIIATSGMDNIERYETNIILCNINKSVANIVENAGVPDMSFGDLVQPKRNRTLRIISALCMLYYKLTEIESKFSQMQSKSADLPTRRHTVEQLVREMKKQIEEKAMYLSGNKIKTVALAQELKDLAETYESKRTNATQMADLTKHLKILILNTRENISELDIELSKLKEEMHELEQKIVKSPDRIQADTKDKELELETKRSEKKKLEKQYMELIRAVDFWKEASKSLMPSLETFADAFKNIGNMKTQCESLCKTKLTVGKREEHLKTLKVQIRELEKTIHTLKHQIVSNEKQYHKQIQTMKEINNGMNKDLKQKTESNTEEERNIIEEITKLKNSLNELDVQHKAFKDLFEAVSAKNEQKLKEVQNLISTRLNEVQALHQKRPNLKMK